MGNFLPVLHRIEKERKERSMPVFTPERLRCNFETGNNFENINAGREILSDKVKLRP